VDFNNLPEFKRGKTDLASFILHYIEENKKGLVGVAQPKRKDMTSAIINALSCPI
jgi:predicted CopG family antitoxin